MPKNDETELTTISIPVDATSFTTIRATPELRFHAVCPEDRPRLQQAWEVLGPNPRLVWRDVPLVIGPD